MRAFRDRVKGSLKSNRILIVSLTLFAISTIFFAYSFTVTWNAPVSVFVYSPSINLKVYWDLNCTNPVTSIDFGILQKSRQNLTYMYVRNEGNGTVRIYWNSSLTPPVRNYFTQAWDYYYYGWSILNGTTIATGQIYQTRYTVTAHSDCPDGQYDWTLQIGALPL